MSHSRIPSPARSQGVPITPRRYKSRTRSVGSPARSTTSVRLSAVAQFKENNKDSFVLSPAPSRRSVLNDDTDIEEPRRRSWWRKLNDNSRDVMEVLNDNKVLETNEAVEEYIDIEVLSQEKKNYTIDLPDSSDSESISSIVIPQRKLFTQKDEAQNKFGQLVGTRETLAKLHKSTVADKTVNVPPKNLFGQGSRPKSKPIFPAALLNLSSNKTVNKTKENVATEVKGQVRSLFGNRAGTKRKNMFADFIVSESEEEISEIQPKVFGFQNKPNTRRESANSRGKREHSPTSSITTDIEMDDWKMLPSSTMVENQLEDMMAAAKTPVKRPRLSKLPDIKETETKSTVEQIEKEPSGEEQELKYDDEDDKSDADDEQQMQDQHEVDDNEHDDIQNNISAQEVQQNKSHATSRNISKVKENNVNQSKTPSVTQQNSVSQHKINLEKEQDVEMEVELTQKQYNNTVVKNKSYRESTALQKDIAEEEIRAQKNDDVVNVDQVDNREECNDQNKSKNNRYVSLNQNRDISQVKSNPSKEDENEKRVIVSHASDNLDEDEQDELNENVDEEMQEENEDQIQNEMDEPEIETTAPENSEEQNEHDNEVQDNDVSMAQESETEQSKDEMDVQNDSRVQNHDDSENNAQNESAAQDHDKSAPEIQSEQKEEEEAQDSEQEDEEDNEVENESLAGDQDNEENPSQIEEEDNDRNASEAEMEQASAVQDDNEMDDKDEINESAEVQNDEDAKENDSDDEKNEDEDALNASAQMQNDEEDDDNESAEANDTEDDQNESAEANDTQDDQNESAEANDTEDDQNESAEVQNDNDDEDEQNESAEMDSDMEDDAQNESVQQQSVDEIQDSNDQQQSDNEAPNESHDTTGRHRKKESNINSPEAILHDKTNQLESFTTRGRNTSVRKTTMLKNLTVRPSLAPPRESTGISDGTTNSSAEGSGWDSHRTTRKTLRQTFGRDFTPRKSLRALVMEKSAKRQTAISEMTDKFPQANSTEIPEASMVPDDCEMTVESNHDVSKRTRQTTLEMYLQKIKKQNMERNLKMQEAVRNSLKAPTTEVLNPFKVPARPMFSSRKPSKAASKPKAKQAESALIPLDDLPPELIEDMKYKPPKRFQPSNASWITKRLYKFLESKLESKYDYKARVRAEKLVQTIYYFAKDLRRAPVAPAPAVEALKLEMARLGVVTTHFDFYQFFHEYMPREVRIKVVPDIVNKISVPRHGVFSDIIRGNTVQG